MSVVESNHPLITHLVSRLRDRRLDPLQVRQTVGDLGRFLFYEAIKDKKLMTKSIPTWSENREVFMLEESDLVFVPILRAGLPMVEAIMTILPYAVGGFMAIKRDEKTLESKLYYDRIPDLTEKVVILCDPMLATGGSLDDAISALKAKGASKIISLNIIATQQGIDRIQKTHPDVTMFIAKVDERIEQGFIYPGIGDAGDRAFNTPS